MPGFLPLTPAPRSCRQATGRMWVLPRARLSFRHADLAGSSLRQPDHSEGLGDPLDDVAHLQAANAGLVANDEKDGVSLGPQARSPEASDDGRPPVRPLGAAEWHEPDHRHDLLRSIIWGHRAR